MRNRLIVMGLLVPAWALVAGCTDNHRATDRLPPPLPMALPASDTGPVPSASTGAGRATTVPADPDTVKLPSSSSGSGRSGVGGPDPDKDKPRGNTPPGTDRSGGGPLDGAIRDPAGAVTKQPEPKAPVQ